MRSGGIAVRHLRAVGLPSRRGRPAARIMTYDLYALQTLETKRKWIAPTVREDCRLVFGHDLPRERDAKIAAEPADLDR